MLSLMASEPRYSIKAVSRRTGLTPHVIRAWERRYRAVQPERTPSNRRLYSEAQVQRLSLLRRAREAGYSIRNLARLSDRQLGDLLLQEGRVPAALTLDSDGDAKSLLKRCLKAAAGLDADELAMTLEQSGLALGQPVLIDEVVAPLLQRIGEMWQRGEIKAAHEHPASAVVRTFLGSLLAQFAPAQQAPTLVAATPLGQAHELGALMVAVTAAAQGWRAVYLGPDLPAEEIAAAVRQTRPAALALSLVYPPDDPRIPAQLRRLRRLVPKQLQILAGGRVAKRYAASLKAIQAVLLDDMPGVRRHLQGLRG